MIRLLSAVGCLLVATACAGASDPNEIYYPLSSEPGGRSHGSEVGSDG